MNEVPDVSSAEAEIATDTILNGKLILRQWRAGHRAGTDAVLLAAASGLKAGDRFIDAGCGVGTVGLAMALRVPGAQGLLLDDDAAILAMARDNCRLNRLDETLRVVCADLFDPASCRAADIPPEGATLVVTNPPFFRGDEMRRSPHPGRARAHTLGRAGQIRDHNQWVRATLSLLAPQGRYCVIHRPEALPQLLAGCEGRLGGVVIMPVHAKRDASAIRILLAGHKGSRAPLRIGRPLVLHGEDGRFTPEAEALHRGEADLVL